MARIARLLRNHNLDGKDLYTKPEQRVQLPLVDLAESFQGSVDAIALGQLEVITIVLVRDRRDFIDTLGRHTKASASDSLPAWHRRSLQKREPES